MQIAMREGQRPIPSKAELFAALEALLELQFKFPEWIEENALARATSLLTLECVGGPGMPTKHERPERFHKVRDLLRKVAPRFGYLSPTALEEADLVYPATEPKGKERYAREAKRLPVGARALFQLQLSEPDREIEMGTIRTATNAIWGKPEHPKSRWFEKERQEFVLEKLAEWIIEYEKTYREANSPPPSDKGTDSPPPITETTSSSPDVALEEQPPSPEPAENDGPEREERRDDDYGDQEEGLANSVTEASAPRPPPVRSPPRRRSGRLAVLAFMVLLAAGALIVAVAVLGGGGGSANVAGKIGRVIDVPAPEDLAVAGGYVWLVDANDQTAIRISETDGERETIFVDEPPFYSDPLPGTRTSIRVGGYQVAARRGRAWIVTNGGVVLSVRTTGRRVEVLHPRIKVINGEPVLYRGSLWVGGFSEHLYRLRATSGAIQGRYVLRGNPFAVEQLAAGVGSIWAYAKSRNDAPRLYKLAPVSGHPGVEETFLPLDDPILDLAAGLGGIWTVDSGGTVTRHDPATGNAARPIQVSGGAQKIALGQEAVWVTTGDNAVARIDPVTLAMIGEPIPLPGAPSVLAADENAWVATAKGLVEIAP